MVTYLLALLVLLSPGDEPMATSLAAAMRAALGAETELELRFVAGPPADDAARALAREGRAASIALIRWGDESHQKAQLRLYDEASARWIVRELVFAKQDAPEEKGRAIGFNLASMMP